MSISYLSVSLSHSAYLFVCFCLHRLLLLHLNHNHFLTVNGIQQAKQGRSEEVSQVPAAAAATPLVLALTGFSE
jgi:hypothetical protein